jgi:hypothetical protein
MLAEHRDDCSICLVEQRLDPALGGIIDVTALSANSLLRSQVRDF